MKGQATRERIIRAVIEVLAANGEIGLRVADVAERAGVKESTLFYYFKNRQELLETAQLLWYRETYMAIVEPMRGALHFSDTPEQWESAVEKVLLDSFVSSRIEVRASRASVAGMAQSSPAVRSELAKINQEVVDHISGLLKAAADRGWVRNDVNLEVLTTVLLGLVAGRSFVEIDRDYAHFTEWDAIVIQNVKDLLRPRSGQTN